MNRLAKVLECRLCNVNNDKVCLPCGHSICVACHNGNSSIQSCSSDCPYDFSNGNLDVTPLNHDLNLLKHIVMSLSKGYTVSNNSKSNTNSRQTYEPCNIHPFMSKTVYCGTQSCAEKALVCVLCFSDKHSGHILFNELKSPQNTAQKLDGKVLSRAAAGVGPATKKSSPLTARSSRSNALPPQQASSSEDEEDEINEEDSEEEDSDEEEQVANSRKVGRAPSTQSPSSKTTKPAATKPLRQDFWHCLDALNDFYDTHKHYRVPENFTVRRKSNGKTLYLGDWLTVIKARRGKLEDGKKFALIHHMENGLWDDVNPLRLSAAQELTPVTTTTTSRSRTKAVTVVESSITVGSKSTAAAKSPATQRPKPVDETASSSRKRPSESVEAAPSLKRPSVPHGISKFAASASAWTGVKSPHDNPPKKPSTDLSSLLPRRSAPVPAAAVPVQREVSPGRVSGDGYSLSDDEALLARDLTPIDPESYTYNAETHNAQHRTSTSGGTTAESSSVNTPVVHIKSEAEARMVRMLAPYRHLSEVAEGSCLAFRYGEEDEEDEDEEGRDNKIGIGRISALSQQNKWDLKLVYIPLTETTADASQFDGLFAVDDNESTLEWQHIVATALEIVEVTTSAGERIFRLSDASKEKMRAVEVIGPHLAKNYQ